MLDWVLRVEELRLPVCWSAQAMLAMSSSGDLTVEAVGIRMIRTAFCGVAQWIAALAAETGYPRT